MIRCHPEEESECAKWMVVGRGMLLFTGTLLNIFRTQRIQPSNHHVELVMVNLGEGFNIKRRRRFPYETDAITRVVQFAQVVNEGRPEDIHHLGRRRSTHQTYQQRAFVAIPMEVSFSQTIWRRPEVAFRSPSAPTPCDPGHFSAYNFC